MEQLLSHAAGLTTVPGYATFIDPDGRGWVKPRRSSGDLSLHGRSGLLGQPPAITVSPLAALRRARAQSLRAQLIGTLIREQVAGPLNLELDLGTSAEKQLRVAPVLPPGRRPVEMAAIWKSARRSRLSFSPGARLLRGRSFQDVPDVLFNDAHRLSIELSFGNATESARALASLYCALACHGGRTAWRSFNPRTIRQLTTERFRGS